VELALPAPARRLALGNLAVARRVRAAASAARAKAWLSLAVALDLGTLVLFKYLGFFMAAALDALSLVGVHPKLQPVQLTLPLGVSFVTFQALSYAIDVYRARGAPDERREDASAVDLLLYVSFFPHLVAGPIVRAKEFLSQIRGPSITVPSRAASASAIVLIVGGLLKKVVLATYLARVVVDPVFADPDASSAVEILAAIYAYAVQIYADFSGYTDMAIGLAALLGVTFPQNFAQPYRAQSLREFWRALAHDPLPVASRLLVRQPRRQPLDPRSDAPQSVSHHAPRRPVARRRVDLCAVGLSARRRARH
jgi:alginate O-acetyltransferase complex protein AlgI